jgi:hypothetical protein
MPAIVFYGIASVVNSVAWFLFGHSIKARPLLNDAFPTEEYDKLKQVTIHSLSIHLQPCVCLYHTALILNVVLGFGFIYRWLKENEYFKRVGRRIILNSPS